MGPFGSQEEAEEAARLSVAAVHEARQRIFRFMEELTPGDLGTFIEILMSITNEGASALHTLIGSATTIQKLKHNRCACGEDHDGEVIAKETAKLEAEKKVDVENDEPAMKEYGLERTPDGMLRCKNCKMGYVSLDDRMLRRPGIDGCSGCQIKSAHG
jgi:hypothetical protein